MLKILAAALALSWLTLNAQTPSGLLAGPVTYTGTLTQNPYGDTTIWTKADGTTCSVVSSPSCYIVHYVVGYGYNLSASDGTGNCYSWDVWQMALGSCQSSFHGGGAGENSAGLYCGNSVSSDINGTYTLSCTASFDGTAIAVQSGIDVPIPALYTVNVTIKHHPVQVWIGPIFRTRRHLEKWQVIDSAVVKVIPSSI